MDERELVGCAYCGDLMSSSALAQHACTARKQAMTDRLVSEYKDLQQRAGFVTTLRDRLEDLKEEQGGDN